VFEASRTWYSSIFALDPNEFGIKEVHPSAEPGGSYTINAGVNSSFSTTASVTFAVDSAGYVGLIIKDELRYARHQNLPVRGIRRQIPKGDTGFPPAFACVDFLLFGGFNTTNNTEYNAAVVSGMLGAHRFQQAAKNTWSITNDPTNKSVHTNSNSSDRGVNKNNFRYYPSVTNAEGNPLVLGDCCVEYIEERNEVICFGGRPVERDTVPAHAVPFVLEFKGERDIDSKWVHHKYPAQPHPRWSAASVLIKDLKRQGEQVGADRIFIIGGRNQGGFVPDVDVFNLSTNKWETDWKGLDDGELENYTPTGGSGGGGITIINQGGDGVQSVRAGTNVAVTGDSKNPIINAYLAWG
jgi:hypothetical protein